MLEYDKIIKGLQCCVPSSLGCEDCPYEDNGDGEIACQLILMEEAYDIIVSQQAEVERLANIIKNVQVYIDDFIKRNG